MKTRFRHELKFIISEEEQAIVRRCLSKFAMPDAHARDGRYMIRSLYFDDWEESAYTEKDAGVSQRKKYRIRLYDCSDKVIHLERKRKEEQYINKVSADLTRQEAERITRGDYSFLWERDERLCKDFYLEHLEKQMHPAVVVDYDREPYVYPYGDVRITFDSHVRCGFLEDGLFDPELPVKEVLEPGQLILEVKFTEFLPYVIRDALPLQDFQQVAASKYTMCMDCHKEFRY